MGTPDVLLSVPNAQLHKVENSVQTLLIEGDFTVSIVEDVGTIAVGHVDPQHLRVEAAVTSTKQDHIAFPLGKHLPALKAAATIYSFAMENTRAAYYCLILPSGTPADVLDAVHDVLQDSCAFTTAKQVDAAYEEADKLQGGNEAAALHAADIAGGILAPATGAAVPSLGVPVAGQAAATTVAAPAQSPSTVHKTTADKIAAGLISGGSLVASAVGQAATATAAAVQNYAQKQIANGKPNENPATISPTFKKGLALAATVASTAAYVTGKLAALVGQASYATALAIAKALPGHPKHKPGEVATAEERSALHKVGTAGLVAFVDVYDSLEQAAQVVLSHSADATTQYITYKYGHEAGDAARSSVPVAQDMLSATMNFSRLGARAFISKTAKKGAKIYLKSTVAGVPLHEQQAGARVKSMSHAVASAVAAKNPGITPAAVSAAPVIASTGAQRTGSSSNLVPNPYPVGSSAAAAAGGQHAL